MQNNESSEKKYTHLDYDRLHLNEWKDFTEYGASSLSRYRIIAKLFKKHCCAFENILEIGSSAGNLLGFIQKKMRLDSKNFIACDFSEEAVKLTKQKGIDSFQADLTKINDFHGKKFEIIICSEVLEHIPDYKSGIFNIYQLLNENGKLIISVPYSMKHWTQHDDFSLHLRRFEKNELENELIKTGFKIEKSFIWGALVYNLYYLILGEVDPKIILKKRTPVKELASKLLYHLLKLDDFFTVTNKGRRIFIVANKGTKCLK